MTMCQAPLAGSRPWPPEFTVRISARARHARLRILPGTGLEVVLPRTMKPETATEIVERHKDWICKTLKRVCGTAGQTTDNAPVPQQVFLHGETVARPVVCGGEPDSGLANAIVIRSPRDKAAAAARELRQWAGTYAAHALGAETAALAERHGLAFSALRFRRQKSRWGSCTAQGALSLNTCLIFLPPDLARHVVLHELAHTRHMDHGRGFWKTLFAMEPDALKLDRRLRSAWRYVPGWMWL